MYKKTTKEDVRQCKTDNTLSKLSTNRADRRGKRKIFGMTAPPLDDSGVIKKFTFFFFSKL